MAVEAFECTAGGELACNLFPVAIAFICLDLSCETCCYGDMLITEL